VGNKEERDRDRANMEKLRQQQQAAQQARLNEAAASEEAAIRRANKSGDQEFDQGIADLLGGRNLSDFRDLSWVDDDQARADLRKIKRYQERGDKDKAQKLFKKKQKQLRKAVEKSKKDAGKKGNGCAVVSLILTGGAVAALAAAVWTAHEVLGALIK
jgi:hypothetical protein